MLAPAAAAAVPTATAAAAAHAAYDAYDATAAAYAARKETLLKCANICRETIPFELLKIEESL